MKTCAHCGKQFDYGGMLSNGQHVFELCHPNEGLDCYRLVTVYGETIGSRMGFDGPVKDGLPIGMFARPIRKQFIKWLPDDYEPIAGKAERV